MQAFVVNTSLALTSLSLECATYIDVVTQEAVSPGEEESKTISAALEAVHSHATTPQHQIKPCILNIIQCMRSRVKEDAEDGQLRAQYIMMTVCGILLEYPFVYYIPSAPCSVQVEKALNNVLLCVVELLLVDNEVEQVSSIIKFSVPQAFRDRSSKLFSAALKDTKRRYLERNRSAGSMLSGRRLECTVSSNTVLQSIAL